MYSITPDDFHVIISTSIDGFLFIDLNGTILETNDSFCQMLGYTRDELLKLHLSSIDANDSKDDIASRFSVIVQRGSLKFETKHRHKDGTSIDVEVSANYSTSHGGSIFSFIRDVSRQTFTREIMAARLRLMEYSLNHSLNELLRETLDEAEGLTGSCIGFYHFKDPDSQILTLQAWSTKTATMFCKAEGTGSHYPISQAGVWADCVHERRPVIHNDYASLPHRKGLPEGHAAVIRELVVPIFRHDKIVAIMGIGNKSTDYTTRDVDAMTQLADLAWDITELKRLIDERMALDQQLQQTQKLESLGVLAGGIAHDFNNILAIIIGHCSLAAMNPDRASEHIPTIEKAADRAAGLCRQMLAYAGKAMFVLTQVDMAALVDEMVQMLKATTNQNVVILTELSPDIPAINGDASQLRQIVMNLIINASEAIGEAQGVIHITLIKTAIKAGQSIKDHLGKVIPSGWYACLEVSDTGCGMDDEIIRRIFEPFYTTKFTGRGLGMSATLGIIKAHHGALQLISKPGQGTAFTIYLPIETNEPMGDESGDQVALTPWHGNGTVLLVEDEVQVASVAKAMLEALGFTVIEALNGRDALAWYHKNASEIRLVLTDIGMPVMDGYTLFRELKTLKPDLPIIISSGFGDMVVNGRIANEEVSGLVSKPYRFDQLRDVLKKVVNGI